MSDLYVSLPIKHFFLSTIFFLFGAGSTGYYCGRRLQIGQPSAGGVGGQSHHRLLGYEGVASSRKGMGLPARVM